MRQASLVRLTLTGLLPSVAFERHMFGNGG